MRRTDNQAVNLATRPTLWPGIVILLAYFCLGSLYALYTPTWQIPDEPAHYNYIRSLATGAGFPVLEAGDYDQAYLSQLTAAKFPPHLSVDAIEYEDHQPPLYYLLAVPFYWIGGGTVFPLRFYSLLLGGAGLVFLTLMLREFAPEHPGLAWLGVGLAAFVPQFLAMMGGINNDALTVALLWLWLWLALRYLRGQTDAWALGIILGALLITKTTGYGALPLAFLAIYLRCRRQGQPLRWALREGLFMLGPALLIGGMWWGRNAALYGWPDILGLQRHDAVVVGQPRTAEWIARAGVLPFLSSAVRTTFRSFWGQFGWMGVVLDERIYQGLALFTLLSLIGAGLKLYESWRAGLEARQRDALILLGASGGLTLAMYLGYNLSFVQHQGRYLFTALPILALIAAMGLARYTERRFAVIAGLGLGVVVIGLAVGGLVRGDLPWWSIGIVLAAWPALAVAAATPEPYRPLLSAALLLGMVILDGVCLFQFIIPQLTL